MTLSIDQEGRPFGAIYRYHLGGTLELRDIQNMQSRSAFGETFVDAVETFHEEVKSQLEKSVAK